MGSDFRGALLSKINTFDDSEIVIREGHARETVTRMRDLERDTSEDQSQPLADSGQIFF